MKFSVVIATHNRAAELAPTLDSLARLQLDAPWELIVVDNNSSDDTERVVRERAAHYPAELVYAFERQQGRSAALNAGIRQSRGGIIATTDDDVRVQPDWLRRAEEALDALGCGYVGGRVLPLWSAPPPAWLPDHGSRQWAVIALLDYGDQPLELTAKAPLGVNMAFRREVFDIAGLWDTGLGRKAGTLLGQEVREWCTRAAAAGLKGFYAPGMVVHHVIPRDRLRKPYFRRWFYWRGISRALLYGRAGLDMESPQQTHLDFTRVPHLLGVPRYLYRTCAQHATAMVRARVRRDPVEAFEHELWLWFFAGLLRQRVADHGRLPESSARRLQRGTAP